MNYITDEEIEKTRIESKKYRIRSLRKRFYFAQIIIAFVIIIILFIFAFYVYLDEDANDIYGTLFLVLSLLCACYLVFPIRLLKRTLRIKAKGLYFSGSSFFLLSFSKLIIYFKTIKRAYMGILGSSLAFNCVH